MSGNNCVNQKKEKMDSLFFWKGKKYFAPDLYKARFIQYSRCDYCHTDVEFIDQDRGVGGRQGITNATICPLCGKIEEQYFFGYGYGNEEGVIPIDLRGSESVLASCPVDSKFAPVTALTSRIEEESSIINRINSARFETLVCDVLRASLEDLGCTVMQTQQTHDGGIDAIVYNSKDEAISIIAITRAKDAKKRVGVDVFRSIIGAKVIHEAKSGSKIKNIKIVSSNGFSGPLESEMKILEKKNEFTIDLVFGEELLAMVGAYNKNVPFRYLNNQRFCQDVIAANIERIRKKRHEVEGLEFSFLM